MVLAPRSSARAGLSTQETLLLVALGVGAALFLFVLFPRLTTSRAAEPRPGHPAAPPEVPEVAGEGEPEVLAAELSEPSLVPENEAPSASSKSEPLAAQVALVTEEAKPTVEGPKLRVRRLPGKPDSFQDDLRAEQREQRKGRRARETEQLEVFGIPVPSRPQRPVADSSPEGTSESPARARGKRDGPDRGRAEDQKKRRPRAE